jgi:uncharacterized membrane protein (DUF2068 family)
MDGESRMPPRLKNSNNIPRGVTLIANVFLCLGGMLFAISALILLPGLVINPYENVSGTERLGLLWIASMVFSVPGIVLSVMTIVSSVGLRKMRKWGLWWSYCAMAVFASFYIPIQGNQFSITTPFDLFSHLIALSIVATEIYLTRIYWQYFMRQP